MKQNMDIYRQPKGPRQTFGARVRRSKVFMVAVLISMVAGLLPIIVDSPKVAEADMLSVLKTAFNGYSTSQNAAAAPRTGANPTAEAIAAAAAAAYKFVCPDGQVESGRVEREGAIRCVPCPNGTVRMYAGGAEACHPPGYKVDYSTIPAGYEVGANGQICRADGQSYAGSFHPRYRSTQPNIGECCNGGFRDTQTIVSGSSVALFVCGGNNPGQTPTPPPAGGGSGGSGQGGGNTGGGGSGGSTGGSATPYTFVCPDGQVESGRVEREGAIRCVPCPNGTVRMYAGGAEACHPPGYKVDYSTIPAGYEVGANGQICLADGQSYAGSFHPRYRSTKPGIGACCNGGYRDSKPIVAGSSVALFICGAPTGAQAAASASGGVATAPTGTPATQSSKLIGSFDSASCTQFSGWALNSADPNGTVTVKFYTGGSLRASSVIGQVTTTVQRDDVNAAQKVAGAHGFNFTVPNNVFTAGQTYRVDAYAVGAPDQLLSASPKTVTCTGGTGTPPPPVPDATYKGGPVDANSTFVISSPGDGSVLAGSSFDVTYYSTANLLSSDYIIFQLDNQAPVGVTAPGSVYRFTNVAPGAHILRGYISHADGTKVPNTSTSRSFTTQ